MSGLIRIAAAAMMTWMVAASTLASESDVLKLEALHQKVLQAHHKNDVDLLLADESDDYVVASHGEITSPTIAERRARFTSYLESTKFEEYRDLVKPLVSVSSDGTLAWVIVQVYARGEQTYSEGTGKPIEFTSAWIELYQKRSGRWFRIGNVSNFKD